MTENFSTGVIVLLEYYRAIASTVGATEKNCSWCCS